MHVPFKSIRVFVSKADAEKVLAGDDEDGFECFRIPSKDPEELTLATSSFFEKVFHETFAPPKATKS